MKLFGRHKKSRVSQQDRSELRASIPEDVRVARIRAGARRSRARQAFRQQDRA